MIKPKYSYFGWLGNHTQLNILKKPICYGTGLIALDVILNGDPATPPKLSAGGSCGNVLSILAFLGWDSYPIARLANNLAGKELVKDLDRWQIHKDFLSMNEDGSTPIIIHRIKKDKQGNPIHRFEFRDPETKKWLPQLKPITKNIAAEILQENIVPEVFYFDRLNPGTYELAKNLKEKGTIIFFEPSSIKDKDQFEEILNITDILKFSHDRIPEYKSLFKTRRCFLEIETQGKEGLLYRSKNKETNHWQRIPGYELVQIVDAAGAGDWCAAGIIQSLCFNGHPAYNKTGVRKIQQALEFGSALGALNCLYDGARGLMYHYTNQQLIIEINKIVLNKRFDKPNLNLSPQINISTKIAFSNLYS